MVLSRPEPPVLVACDLDGTLAPLRPHPARTRLPHAAREALRRLVQRRAVRVAVLSGRRLAEVRRLVRLRGVAFGGNHGLELEAGGRIWIHPAARRARPRLVRAARALRRRLAGVRGVWVEDKGLTLTVHYRAAPRRAWPAVARAARTVREGLRLRAGKRTWELRPSVAWDKGRAVGWLRRRLGCGRVIYLGDDRTDEDAFRALRRGDLGVRVGPGATRAAARVRSPRDAARWLDRLAGTLA